MEQHSGSLDLLVNSCCKDQTQILGTEPTMLCTWGARSRARALATGYAMGAAHAAAHHKHTLR